MHPIRIDRLSAEEHAALDHAYRTAKDGWLLIRALLVLLAAERGIVAADIAAVVRMHEETVRRWLVRYQAEDLNGLVDAPRPGVAPKATRVYREQLLAIVRRRRRKRRREIAELLEAVVDKHPHVRGYVAWDNSGTHQDGQVEAVVRGAAGRLVLLYLPTCSPWLNPTEMLRRHFRPEVTHCELFESISSLLTAARDFFERYNRRPGGVRSILRAHPA